MELKSVFNMVKKESLLFKKKVITQHADFCEKISGIVNMNNCFLLTPEMAQAIYFKAKYQGIESKIHKDYNKIKSVSLSCELQIELTTKRQDNTVCFIILPTDWELSGGFIVNRADLLSNFWKLSYVMEDDFIIFDKSLSNSILCSGDRMRDRITNFDMSIKGCDFEVSTLSNG